MNNSNSQSLPPILPAGTRVVSRVEVKGDHGRGVHPSGAVAVIAQAPGDHLHAYRVRFLDGFEASLKRDDLAVLSHFQSGAAPLDLPSGRLEEHEMYPHVIYRCVVGSRAYGLDESESDYDRRGVYLPPAERHWSLFGVPEQIEDSATQDTYWELQKFLVLALKANPNVLECLYTPLVEHANDIAQELLSIRGCFLSKLVYPTYQGYVASQFKKLEADLRNKGHVKWKHVMHLLRLLLSGIGTLREGAVPVHVGQWRDALLAVRRGERAWEELNRWRLEVHAEFDEAYRQTQLPERPDYTRVNDFLVKARRAVV